MANYYLNDNGTTSVRKQGKGKNYILQDDGNVIENKVANNTIKEKRNKSATVDVQIAKNKEKTAKKEYQKSLSDYQKQLNRKFEKNNIDFKTDLESKKEKTISYKNKAENVIENKNVEKLETNKTKVKKIRNSLKEENNKVQDSLNKLNYAKYETNKAKVTNEDTNLYDKTIGIIPRAVSDLMSPLTISQREYINEKGKKEYLPTYNKMKQEKVSNDYETGVGKFLGDSGYTITKIATSSLLPGPLGSGAYFTDMFTDNYEDVINEGYTKKQAFMNSTVSTGLDFVTGKLFGSATKKLTGGATNEFSKMASNTFNKMIKRPKVANILGNASSEALEEFSQEYLDNFNRLLTLEQETDIKKYIDVIKDKDVFSSALYSAGVGGLSGGFLEGINNSEGKSAASNTRIFNSLKETLEAKRNKTSSKAEIEKYNNAIKIIDNYIEKPFTVSASDVYDKVNNVATLPTGLNQNINNNSQEFNGNPLINNNRVSMPLDSNTVNRLNNQNNAFNQSLENESINTLPVGKNGLNSQNSEEISNINPSIVNDDSVAYEYVPDSNTKIDNLRKSANQYLNNSNTSKSFIETAEKVINDKGYNIILDNNLTAANGNMVNAQIKTRENGETEIRINPNSDRAGEFLLTHEITHAIETKDMVDLVTDYASKNQEFNSALESLKETYGTNEVSSEVLADISGQLFGNEEFINTLSVQKPNIFKRIYNKIVSLANKITGNSKESLFIRDLKAKWEKAYRDNNNKFSKTEYMMTSLKGMEQSVKASEKYQEIKDRYDAALWLENKTNKSTSKKYTNEEIRKITGWFKDKEGNWEFEVSDKNTKVLDKLSPNTSYKLSEIFEAKTLYDLYPELKNVELQTKNMKSNGSFNSQSNKIMLNNKLLNNSESVRGTILHEIQHYIQNVEGLPTGTTILFGNERYANSKGEIEAADTKNRRNMTVEERKRTSPESSKKNPIHPNREDILNHKRNIKEKIAEKLYNILETKNTKSDDIIDNVIDKFYNKYGEDIYENIENYEEQIANQVVQTSKKDIRSDGRETWDGLGNRRQNDVNKELDNSSFSFDENVKQYDDLKKTNNIEFFKKDNGDIRINLIDSNNNLVNQFDIISKNNAIKELGNSIGEYIYNNSNADTQKINIGNDINKLGTDTDYFMTHRPSEDYGNASNFEANMADVFEHPEWYMDMTEPYNRESLAALRKVRNNPDAEIKIYRATPGNKINPGDWITPSKKYAEEHNYRQFDGKANILEMKVKAKDILFAGDDINEFGYFPQNKKYSKENGSWQDFVEKSFKSKGTKSYFKDMKLKESKNIERDLRNKEIKKIQSKNNKLKKSKQKIMTKEASKILQFSDYQTKQKFQNLISEYYDNPDYNKIRKDILENFSEQKIEYVNDELNEIKRNIRSTDLKVDDYVKKNLTDYSFFRKSNFNKLKLKNEGQSIDSFYTELSDMYPSIFSKDITNEVDQLHRLSEFMNEDNTLVEKYKLDDKAIDEATKYIYDSLKDNVNIDDIINSINISPKEIRREKTNQYREEAEDFVKDSFNWKDKKSGLAYKINTMKRNFYDIMPKKDAARIYTNYIEPIFKHNADMQKDIETYNKRIEKLKLNDKESTAVQMLGEYKYNPETLLTGSQIDEFISKNKLDYDKISNAVEEFRGLYDELYDRVNAVLKSQGYKEVDYRKGYFPHFIDDKPTSIIGKLAEKLGWKFKNNDLPTSIAGITDQFKPGKVWTSFSQQRKGKITDYNVLKGFDNYIRGAMQDIYFTEDIQKLRALENEIRYQHSDKGVQSKIDEIYDDTSLSFEDRQDKIEKIYATYITPLNNFVTELRDYTNGIANKKSGLDRTVEALSNRKFYNVMENVSSRLSANMVGMNLGSAITNFIPITQAASQVKSKYLLKGLKEAIKNQYSADGFDNKSVFLTSRLNEADRLYKTKLEKVSEKMNFMFDGIDSITSNTIVRAKYYENKAKGMSEFNAIRNADEFARDLMAGRTKGEMPTAFNSKNPLIKMFTSFQLEVNNQFGYMLKDLPRDLGDETKKKLIGAFVKMFIGAWMYNQLTEKVVGRKASFSPIDTIKEIYDTATNDNLKITDKSADILENLTQDIPFVGGLVGGGRLPISSVANPLNVIKGESTIKDELKKLGYYTILPFGGGQLKKTIEGTSMYTNKKEIKGSYTSKGDLRFEAKEDPLSVAQNFLFGQYSSKSAREYFAKGYAPIDAKTMKKLQKQNLTVDEYRKCEDNYSSLKTKSGKKINDIKSDKVDGKPVSGSASAKKAYLIMNSHFSKKEKNYMLSKLTSSDKYPKVSDLEKLPNDKKIYKFYYSMNNDSRKEFNKELNNLDISADKLCDYYLTRKKYNNEYVSSFAKSKMMDYIQNSNLNENTKWYLYNKDYGSESLELLKNTFSIKTSDYFNVMKYSEKIKNEYSGEKQSKLRKSMIYQYINNLKISAKQKIILFKQAGYTTSVGKASMYDYINNLNLSAIEKQEIWDAIY
jgi:hypothetical protein